MMFWTPESIWENETVFIVGGGPSLRYFDFDTLRGKNVLAINEAYREVHWADVLFFRDYEWFERVRPDLSFSGLIVTTSSRAFGNSRIKVIEVGTEQMPRARTSGHNAVALAITMGAAKIVLLGFDWNIVGGNYHDRYPTQGLRYNGSLVGSWMLYRDMAYRVGVEIINATPNSQIDTFPRATYEDMHLL